MEGRSRLSLWSELDKVRKSGGWASGGSEVLGERSIIKTPAPWNLATETPGIEFAPYPDNKILKT